MEVIPGTAMPVTRTAGIREAVTAEVVVMVAAEEVEAIDRAKAGGAFWFRASPGRLPVDNPRR